MQPGQLLLRLGWLGTYVQAQHDDFADTVGQGAIPIVHDQDLAISEARLALDVGLTSRFAASLVVPVRVVSTSIVYRNGMGMPVQLTEPDVHHRNDTLTGIADPMVLGATAFALGSVRLTARAGTTIPLGRTEQDPFALGDMGLRHEHIQMGTGTFNPVVALEASSGWDAWRAGGFLFTQQVVYENAKGYHAGDRYAAGLSLRRALGSVWSVRGGPEFQAETAERWNGVTHTNEGNQGRVDVMIAAGVAWNAPPALSVDFALKVPVYTHVVGGQLDVPAIIELGAAWTFGGKGTKAHEHEHEHGDHAHGDHAHDHDKHEPLRTDKHETHDDKLTIDTAGADVADIGGAGQRVELVPVPGKLTIFDFWAHWCEPCKVLEPALVDIARVNPNVAIRRVEVIDWDSPVVAQHLTRGGYDLPHVKVYDAKQSLVLEQSSAPGKLAALIEAVRALAAPPAQPPPAQPAQPTPPVQPTPPAQPTPAKPEKPIVTQKPLVIEIVANERGYAPSDIKVPRNRPIVLRFRRTAAKSCATEVIFEHDGKRVVKDLPLDKSVDLAITFEQRGTITYRCAMNMFTGTITVQ
jgi:thiol-disulfide isomerase/thioredoxin